MEATPIIHREFGCQAFLSREEQNNARQQDGPSLHLRFAGGLGAWGGAFQRCLSSLGLSTRLFSSPAPNQLNR